MVTFGQAVYVIRRKSVGLQTNLFSMELLKIGSSDMFFDSVSLDFIAAVVVLSLIHI